MAPPRHLQYCGALVAALVVLLAALLSRSCAADAPLGRFARGSVDRTVQRLAAHAQAQAQLATTAAPTLAFMAIAEALAHTEAARYLSEEYGGAPGLQAQRQALLERRAELAAHLTPGPASRRAEPSP